MSGGQAGRATVRRKPVHAALLAALILIPAAACTPSPPSERKTPPELLAGTMRFDLDWGASVEAVVDSLNTEGIDFNGPNRDEGRVKAFPDEPGLWVTTIEVVINPTPGFGCRPVTQILFKFKTGTGLYDIKRSAASLCTDPW